MPDQRPGRHRADRAALPDERLLQRRPREAEQVDEYNWIYTSRANGGSGICEDNPATTTCITPLNTATGFPDYIVPLETRIALGRVLGNDPRRTTCTSRTWPRTGSSTRCWTACSTRYRALFADNTPFVTRG